MNCHFCMALLCQIRANRSQQNTQNNLNESRFYDKQTKIKLIKMVTPGVDVCAYCKKSNQGLDRLNSNDLLNMMKQHDPMYGRTTRFCADCKRRAIAKLERRQRNETIMAKKASRSAGQQTTSYSNTSNPVLSQSSSNRSNSQSTTGKRAREEDEPRRNVGKRTGGRPRNRDNSDATSSQSQRQPQADQPIPLFIVPANAQISSSSSQPTNSQSNDSVATNGYLDVTDNDENDPPSSPNQRRRATTAVSIAVSVDNQRSNRSNSSSDSSQHSFQAAPVPRNRPVRDFPRPTGG